MGATGEANAATRNRDESVDVAADPPADGDQIRRRLLTLAVQDYDDGDLDFSNGIQDNAVAFGWPPVRQAAARRAA
jgi:hypothetical protein